MGNRSERGISHGLRGKIAGFLPEIPLLIQHDEGEVVWIGRSGKGKDENVTFLNIKGRRETSSPVRTKDIEKLEIKKGEKVCVSYVGRDPAVRIIVLAKTETEVLPDAIDRAVDTARVDLFRKT